MQDNNLIKGNSEEEIWQHIAQQFLENPDPLEYVATIEHNTHRVVLDIDIDLGGGFESGYETTSFTAAINRPTDFRFAIHQEHFTDEIGKFFGMQDVVLGYEEFDKKLIIKTNDPQKLKQIFSEESTRAVIQKLENFTFGITTHHTGDCNLKQPFLELMVETGITDVSKLREIYRAYFAVLSALDTDTIE
jgi:hypothetical protein